MFKNKFKILVSILMLSTMILSSCGSSSDDNNITINNFSPDNGTVIYIGDPIAISANIESDQNVSSYQIDVYKNSTISDTQVNKRSVIEEVPFETTVVGSLNGKDIKFSTVVDVTLFTGENNNPVQEGDYKLVVTIKDKSNNQAVVTRDLIFKNK